MKTKEYLYIVLFFSFFSPNTIFACDLKKIFGQKGELQGRSSQLIVTEKINLMGEKITIPAGTFAVCSDLQPGTIRLDIQRPIDVQNVHCDSNNKKIFYLGLNGKPKSLKSCTIGKPINLKRERFPIGSIITFSRDKKLITLQYYSKGSKKKKSQKGSYLINTREGSNPFNNAIKIPYDLLGGGDGFLIHILEFKEHIRFTLNAYNLPNAGTTIEIRPEKIWQKLNLFLPKNGAVSLYLFEDRVIVQSQDDLKIQKPAECYELSWNIKNRQIKCLSGKLVKIKDYNINLPNISFKFNPIREVHTTKNIQFLNKQFAKEHKIGLNEILTIVQTPKIKRVQKKINDNLLFEIDQTYPLCGKLNTVDFFSQPNGTMLKFTPIELCFSIEAGLDWSNLFEYKVMDLRKNWIKISRTPQKENWGNSKNTIEGVVGWVKVNDVTTPLNLVVDEIEYPIPMISPEAIRRSGAKILLEKRYHDSPCDIQKQYEIKNISLFEDQSNDDKDRNRSFYIHTSQEQNIRIKRNTKAGAEFQCRT